MSNIKPAVNLTALLSERSDVDLSPLAGAEVLICHDNSPLFTAVVAFAPECDFGVTIRRENQKNHKSVLLAFRKGLRGSEGYSVHVPSSDQNVVDEIFVEKNEPEFCNFFTKSRSSIGSKELYEFNVTKFVSVFPDADLSSLGELFVGISEGGVLHIDSVLLVSDDSKPFGVTVDRKTKMGHFRTQLLNFQKALAGEDDWRVVVSVEKTLAEDIFSSAISRAKSATPANSNGFYSLVEGQVPSLSHEGFFSLTKLIQSHEKSEIDFSVLSSRAVRLISETSVVICAHLTSVQSYRQDTVHSWSIGDRNLSKIFRDAWLGRNGWELLVYGSESDVLKVELYKSTMNRFRKDFPLRVGMDKNSDSSFFVMNTQKESN